MLYTDESMVYDSLLNHETVRHSVGEYVQEQAHTNGIESFWALPQAWLLRHVPQDEREASSSLYRRVRRVTQRPCRRYHSADGDYGAQGMIGKRLSYQELIADP